jgi:hypothetical protein
MIDLDFIDKLDDIIYEPVNAICEWVKEPLKSHERKHQLNTMQKQADIEKQSKMTDFEIERKRAELDMAQRRESETLVVDMRKYNAEIDEMINQQEDARRDRLVESLKRYQMDLVQASIDISNEINKMSAELEERVQNLAFEQTQKYIAMQGDAMERASQRLEDIQVRFADNESARMIMESAVKTQLNMIIVNADKFINDLRDDIQRLNQNFDALAREGANNANRMLEPLAQQLGTSVIENQNRELLTNKY